MSVLTCERCGGHGEYERCQTSERFVRIICRKCGNAGGWANSDPTAVLLWRRFNESGIPESLGKLDKKGGDK